MKIRLATALVLMTVSVAPATAQNRFMDQAREAAERRAEHRVIWQAENPETAKRIATAHAAPTETAVAPAEAPVSAAAPATPRAVQ